MMTLFYISAAVALVSSVLAISRSNAVHALLYAIVSLLAVAMTFFILGAPFAAALEVVIYAGAIMVLFVFVVMMISSGPGAVQQERKWMDGRLWIGPSVLTIILVAELLSVMSASDVQMRSGPVVESKQVGITLLGPYMLGVELASLLLTAGLVGAYHIGKHTEKNPQTKDANHD
ncbi:MAG TPA: NADH-quinone oxidoreductase subunit J [Dissulfurispiraceae bacterium]|nr:NADH-quinone oxidoreductase subunit J [Dissulfurispiraceae bacterium]